MSILNTASDSAKGQIDKEQIREGIDNLGRIKGEIVILHIVSLFRCRKWDEAHEPPRTNLWST
jgi:hypothetical protein